MHAIPCNACDTTGLVRKDSYPRGFPLELCPVCHGVGQMLPSALVHGFFRAIWLVGAKHMVRMTVPKQRGGTVELDIQWMPSVPPKKGRGKLTPEEQREYEQGRDLALAEHVNNIGGEYSLVTAGKRH